MYGLHYGESEEMHEKLHKHGKMKYYKEAKHNLSKRPLLDYNKAKANLNMDLKKGLPSKKLDY